MSEVFLVTGNNGQRFKTTAPLLETVRQLHLAGHLTNEVARRVGRDRHAVAAMLEHLGIRRVRTEWKHVEQEAIRLYESGLTQSEVGQRVGMTPDAIQRNLHRLGLSRPNRKHPIDANIFSPVSTPEAAWALGFITTDGSVGPDQIQIRLARRDEDAIVSLRRILGSTCPIARFMVKNPRAGEKDLPVSLASFCSKDLVATLRGHGLASDKTACARPWQTTDDNLLRAYVRGLIDGDGSIGVFFRRSDHLMLTPKLSFCGNEHLLGWWAWLMESRFGARVYVHVRGPMKKHPDTLFMKAEIGNRRIIRRILAWMYEGSTVALERKRVIAEEILLGRPNPLRENNLRDGPRKPKRA